MLEYIDNFKRHERVAHQNFLNPKEIVSLKNELNERSEFIFKLKGKNYKIWK